MANKFNVMALPKVAATACLLLAVSSALGAAAFSTVPASHNTRVPGHDGLVEHYDAIRSAPLLREYWRKRQLTADEV